MSKANTHHTGTILSSSFTQPHHLPPFLVPFWASFSPIKQSETVFFILSTRAFHWSLPFHQKRNFFCWPIFLPPRIVSHRARVYNFDVVFSLFMLSHVLFSLLTNFFSTNTPHPYPLPPFASSVPIAVHRLRLRMWPKAWRRVWFWSNLQEFCSSGYDS